MNGNSIAKNEVQSKISLKTIAILAIFGIAIYYVVPKFIGAKESLFLLARLNIPLFILAIVLESISYLGLTLLYREIMDVFERRIRFRRLIKMATIGNFVTHVLPIGGMGELMANFYFFRGVGLSSGQSLLFFVIRTAFNFSAFGFFLLVGSLYASFHGGLLVSQKITIFVLVAFCLAVFGFIIYLYFHKTYFHKTVLDLAKPINWIRQKILKKEIWSHEQLLEAVDDIYRGIDLLRKSGHNKFLILFLFSALFWLGDILCLGIVFYAFGYNIHLGILFLGYTLAFILGFLSFIPAGLGVIEGSMGLLFTGMGVPSGVAWMSVLVYRLISFWFTIPIGLYSFFSLRRDLKKEDSNLPF
jgi:uncharacterized protein (TIRG00374 family)